MTSSIESPTTSTNIRWGIVGLGDVCQSKSGPAFYKCQGSELVAVMRRTPGKAQEWVHAKQLKKCVGYDNLDAFLKHPNMDAVYISTRPGTHLELSRRVAAAGKAVYIEKPVGRCAAETEAIIDACDTAGVPLYTAYISRAYERTHAIRNLLLDGIIGPKVTSVSYTLVGMGGARGMETTEMPWRLDAAQSGGGLIMDVGCHVVDRLDYLLGPLLQVKGKAENKASRDVQKVEDYVHFDATIGACDWAPIPSAGASVSCTWDFSSQPSSPKEVDEWIITGPNGSLRMAGMSPAGPIEVLDPDGKVLKVMDEFIMPEHTAQGLIQFITDDLRGITTSNNNGPVVSRGTNALRTQNVLDEALSSYYGGREIGYWERPDSWPGCSA